MFGFSFWQGGPFLGFFLDGPTSTHPAAWLAAAAASAAWAAVLAACSAASSACFFIEAAFCASFLALSAKAALSPRAASLSLSWAAAWILALLAWEVVPLPVGLHLLFHPPSPHSQSSSSHCIGTTFCQGPGCSPFGKVKFFFVSSNPFCQEKLVQVVPDHLRVHWSKKKREKKNSLAFEPKVWGGTHQVRNAIRNPIQSTPYK